MKYARVLLLLFFAFAFGSSSAQANPWLFLRSHYSYSPSRGIPTGPNRFARAPIGGYGYSGYFRGGYSRKDNRIVVGGRTVDDHQEFESWFEYRSRR